MDGNLWESERQLCARLEKEEIKRNKIKGERNTKGVRNYRPRKPKSVTRRAVIADFPYRGSLTDVSEYFCAYAPKQPRPRICILTDARSPPRTMNRGLCSLPRELSNRALEIALSSSHQIVNSLENGWLIRGISFCCFVREIVSLLFRRMTDLVLERGKRQGLHLFTFSSDVSQRLGGKIFFFMWVKIWLRVMLNLG